MTPLGDGRSVINDQTRAPAFSESAEMSRKSLPDFLNIPAPQSEQTNLKPLGWKPQFDRQLAEAGPGIPARVMAVHRDRFDLLTAKGDARCRPRPDATIGDWLLLDPDTGRVTALLDRHSVFKRRAPGTGRQTQLIAANVDTLFIVSSCNRDFNPARLERYLALAHEASVTPVIVLTKSDLTDDADRYRRMAASIQSGLLVETCDATDPETLSPLRPWCGPGDTVALIGSSGVGKSTIANALTGKADMQTGAIRENDARGRHTTSHRQMLRLTDGGWLIDTPGMRELQLTDARQGIDDVFSDLAELADACRFRDCGHDGEPGCAIAEAIGQGTVDPARLARWRKLRAEEAFNAQSLAERRAADKAFGKMVRGVMKDHRKNRG